MKSFTREERDWFLRTLAQGLVEYMGIAEPPVPVEEILRHPPEIFGADFGVVDMYSNLWDATFARPPSKRGSVFIRADLSPKDRRFALAREMLIAMVTSKHGKELGLQALVMDDLQDAAEYFARSLLAPEPLINAYRKRNGGRNRFSDTFELREDAADKSWEENQFSFA
jgi:hypothetical protein